jgi:mxaJ protein
VLLTCCIASAALGEEDASLRVCADPDNLPYSNEAGQGFENKIAELVARELGLTLSYYWYPHQRGLVRATIQADRCDVLIGIPKGYDPVLWTKPYYRSTHVLASLADRNLKLRSLDDPALKTLRIGVHVNTPGYDALANHGLAENIRSYRLYFDARDLDPSVRPQRVLEDVVSGTTDAAVAWGPTAGYFVKNHPSPALEITPLADEAREALAYEFSMGVRKGERELKARLEAVLDKKAAEVKGILEEYGVPLLPLEPAKESAEEKRPPPDSHRHDTQDD